MHNPSDPWLLGDCWFPFPLPSIVRDIKWFLFGTNFLWDSAIVRANLMWKVLAQSPWVKCFPGVWGAISGKVRDSWQQNVFSECLVKCVYNSQVQIMLSEWGRVTITGLRRQFAILQPFCMKRLNFSLGNWVYCLVVETVVFCISLMVGNSLGLTQTSRLLWGQDTEDRSKILYFTGMYNKN